MKTTERFEKAVRNWYEAFHKNKLNAFSCKACAIGSLTNGSMMWAFARKLTGAPGDVHGTIGIHEPNAFNYGQAIEVISRTGYSVEEIIGIENAFLQHFKHQNGTCKESQFKGLCAVIEYLATLDNIPNPMDYSALFETENDKPKYSLETVFV